MSHIFISYSKKNKEYAQLLKSELIRQGFSVWIDDVIEPSEDWWRNIRQAIKDAAAIALIMTPESETSHYVGLELLHALEYKKPIFPLLRVGDVNLFNSDTWSRIANIQYTDVREGGLPPDSFYAKLTAVQKRIEQAVQSNDGWTPQVEVTGTPQPVSPQTQAELTEFVKRNRQFEYELVPPTPSHPQMWGVENILPQPFEWVYIPAGSIRFEINNNVETFPVDTFNIAKYPITNAQFEVFIQSDDGYNDPNWWNFDMKARTWREKSNSIQPRAFSEDDHPRANVNYYEALAFSNWLAARFNAPAPNLPKMNITLPTIQQWHRAAFGDDNRRFPWGNEFKTIHCNSQESGKGRTTSVTKYPLGASLYGVFDMIGNVWELCNVDDLARQVTRKIGGSFASSITSSIQDSYIELKQAQNNQTGFRIVMMNS